MKTLLLPLLLLAVIATGMGAAYAKHQSRKLFIELQALESERDAMNVDETEKIYDDEDMWSVYEEEE